MTEQERQKVDDEVFAWLEHVPEIPQDVRGVEYTAPCSCGGMIRAIRSKYNGHFYARCDACGMMIRE